MKRIATTAIALASLATLGLGAETAQASLPATPVTVANLPSTSQLAGNGAVRYTVLATRTNTTAKVSVCQKAALRAYAPNRVLTRAYAGRPNAVAGAQVASFATHARAVAVAADLSRTLKGCAARTVKANPDLLLTFTEYTRTVRASGGQLMYLHAMNMTDGELGSHFIIQDGVVATGTHVEYLTIAVGNTNGSMDTRAIQKTLTRTLGTLAG